MIGWAMDEKKVDEWRRAFLVYGLSMMVGGMATGLIIYILLPIEVVFVTAAVVALVSGIVAFRSVRTLRRITRELPRADDDKA